MGIKFSSPKISWGIYGANIIKSNGITRTDFINQTTDSYSKIAHFRTVRYVTNDLGKCAFLVVREKGFDLFYRTITMFLYRHTAHGAVMGQAFF
jgi:hypothetical protein